MGVTRMRILNRVLRGVVAIGLCWCVLVEVVEVFAGCVFNMRVDGDWFLLLAASSGKEVAEFFQLYGQQVTLGISGIVVGWAVVLGLTLFARRRVWWCWLAVVLLYVGGRLACSGLMWPPLYMAYDTVRGCLQYAELIQAGAWHGGDSSDAVGEATGRTNLVVVIGESMTTDRMSLYGYGKPTTPCLDALKERLTVLGPVRPN